MIALLDRSRVFTTEAQRELAALARNPRRRARQRHSEPAEPRGWEGRAGSGGARRRTSECAAGDDRTVVSYGIVFPRHANRVCAPSRCNLHWLRILSFFAVL